MTDLVERMLPSFEGREPVSETINTEGWNALGITTDKIPQTEAAILKRAAEITTEDV
jgi:hypothetical protein